MRELQTNENKNIMEMKIEGEKRLDLMCEIERLKGLEEQVDKD